MYKNVTCKFRGFTHTYKLDRLFSFNKIIFSTPKNTNTIIIIIYL